MSFLPPAWAVPRATLVLFLIGSLGAATWQSPTHRLRELYSVLSIVSATSLVSINTANRLFGGTLSVGALVGAEAASFLGVTGMLWSTRLFGKAARKQKKTTPRASIHTGYPVKSYVESARTLFALLPLLTYLSFRLVLEASDVRQKMEDAENSIAVIAIADEIAKSSSPLPSRRSRTLKGLGPVVVTTTCAPSDSDGRCGGQLMISKHVDSANRGYEFSFEKREHWQSERAEAVATLNRLAGEVLGQASVEVGKEEEAFYLVRRAFLNSTVAVPVLDVSFPSASARWVISAVFVGVLLLLRGRLRPVMNDPRGGVEVPWAMVDHGGHAESSIAITGILFVLVSPTIVGTTLLLSGPGGKATVFYAGEFSEWFVASVLLATLGTTQVALSVVGRIFVIRAARQALDAYKPGARDLRNTTSLP